MAVELLAGTLLNNERDGGDDDFAGDDVATSILVINVLVG